MHTVTLSSFTNPNGAYVHQPMLNGMPLSAELSDREVARNIAIGAAASLSSGRISFRTWDGDAGVLEEVESL